MPKSVSKAFAAAFLVLTVAVIGGIITMVIFYKTQIGPMNPTARPTLLPTTLAPPPDRRLPKSLVPEKYRIFIQTLFYHEFIEKTNITTPNQTLFFGGNSTVNFQCVERTMSIYLHSEGLNVSNPTVWNRDTDEKIKVSSYHHHGDESDFLQIDLNEVLETNMSYSLSLDFNGKMSEYLEGLYISTYNRDPPDSEGDKSSQRFLAATHLEPTMARQVFPCFDEPEMKAVFETTIIHRKDTTVLGNAEAKAGITQGNFTITNFYETPKMSTYLFAFTVSDFTAIQSPNRVKINIYARPDATAAGHTRYAAEITGKMLSFFENYFGIDYVQNKLDQIALPDLEPIAMENWGLITYEQGSLLFEEGVSSLLHKENIAEIIAHELAHQWFGNLVTMEWWNEIWLNEGFATHMSYLAVDAVEPTFQVKDMLIMAYLHSAFEVDALVSSHPLSVPMENVQTKDEIFSLFDTVTYSKGAMILRMLEDRVEERVFHKGIKMYLEAYRYGNVDQDDLWKYIQKAVYEHGSKYEVAKLMKPWTNQNGYPVITINTTSGMVSQKQFLFNNSHNSDLWWPVPIRVMSEGEQPVFAMLETNVPVELTGFSSKNGKWILANVNCTGYYRVNYDPENWERLLNELSEGPDRIPVMNRGQLVDDAFNLARANLVSLTLALNSTRFLRNEMAYLPWESAVRNLEYFVLMFDRSEVYGPMQAYLREQVRGLYNYFKNDTDNSTVPTDHSLQHNQITAINVACSNGLKECIQMASDKYSAWMNDQNGTNMIHPNLRSVIYCQAVAAGGRKEWEFAWNKYLRSNETSEKSQLREALACTKKIWLLNRYLEYTLDPEKIRLMDVPSTLNSIAKNEAGQALTWNFIRANWDYVSQGVGPMLIEGVAKRFSTPFELQELEYFAKMQNLTSTVWVKQAIEQTQVNIKWIAENKEAILEWFEMESDWMV